MHFGDSVRKVVSIIGKTPTSVDVAVLASNDTSESNLLSDGICKDHFHSMKHFKTYEQQQTYYQSHIFALVDGTKDSLGTSFPSIKVLFSCDCDTVSKYFREFMRSLEYDISDDDSTKTASNRGIIRFTARPFDCHSIIGIDCDDLKIRTAIYDDGGQTALVIEAIMSPFIPDENACTTPMINKFCTIDYDCPDDEKCLICMALELSLRHSVPLMDNFLKECKEKGLLHTEKPDVRLPADRRFPNGIKAGWDSLRQLMQ